MISSTGASLAGLYRRGIGRKGANLSMCGDMASVQRGDSEPGKQHVPSAQSQVIVPIKLHLQFGKSSPGSTDNPYAPKADVY